MSKNTHTCAYDSLPAACLRLVVASSYGPIRSSSLHLHIERRCPYVKAHRRRHRSPLRCLHHILELQEGIAHRCAAFTTSLNCRKASYAAVASEGADMENMLFGTVGGTTLLKALKTSMTWLLGTDAIILPIPAFTAS